MKLSRWLPGAIAALLLLLALVAPTRGVRARSGPMLDSAYQPACALVLLEGGGGSADTFATNEGLLQPFIAAGNVAACSVSLAPPGSTTGEMAIVKWDPAALAPDPAAVALRSRSFNASQILVNHAMAAFDPPVILHEHPQAAEKLGSSFAIRYVNRGFGPQVGHYDDDGSPAIPAARAFSGSTTMPLAGAHPVLDHRICGGDASLQELQATQSVITSDGTLGLGMFEVAQRFRVPVSTDLRWIEFGAATLAAGTSQPRLLIYDAGVQEAPPLGFGAPLVNAAINYSSAWSLHFDLDAPVVLDASRWYWLVFRSYGRMSFRAHSWIGTEGADFTSRIGPAFMRQYDGYSWYSPSPQTVPFRVIGKPVPAVSVDPTGPARGGLTLAVTPSPARGRIQLAFTGARGAVRFEVLDARGRRMGEGTAAGGDGRWSWRESSADVPAGVYFVRARDAAGREASRRVVLVR